MFNDYIYVMNIQQFLPIWHHMTPDDIDIDLQNFMPLVLFAFSKFHEHPIFDNYSSVDFQIRN